jgi:exodeoxyribonuclease V beta subunit
MGGVFYLFIRGVRPDWKMPNGNPCGVFFHRANASLIEALLKLVFQGELT